MRNRQHLYSSKTSFSAGVSISSSGFLRVAMVTTRSTTNRTIVVIPIINHSRGTTATVHTLLSAPAYSASPDQLALIEYMPAEEGLQVYEYRPLESVVTIPSTLSEELPELTYNVTVLPGSRGEIEPLAVMVLPAIANLVETVKDKEELAITP